MSYLDRVGSDLSSSRIEITPLTAGPISTGHHRRVDEARSRLAERSRATLADDVYETVKALVMDSQIEPGARVSIDALARDLDVSPTPIREALARLESDGLVVKRPRSGYRTTPLLTAAELRDLFELRLAIEPAAARLAAERANADEAATVRNARQPAISLRPDSAYDDYRSFSASDADFHGAIALASHNPMLHDAWLRTHAHLHLFRLYVPGASSGPTLAEHRAIAAAIVARDGEAAAAAMVAHLQASYDRVAGGLGASVDGGR